MEVHPPPALQLSAFAIGTVRTDVSTAAIIPSTGAGGSVSVAAQAAITSTTLPDISIDLTGRTDLSAGSRFRGGVSLVMKGRAGDKRSLTIDAQPIKLTARAGDSHSELEILEGSKLVITGTDASGNVTAAVRLDDLEEASPGLLTAATVGGSTRLTFHPAAIVAAVRAKLGAGQAGHPIGLLEARGMFDLLIEFQGFPIVNANGRVNEVLLAGLTVL